MAATGRTAHAEVQARPSSARQRILAAADDLFYGEGIRAVSADRVIAAAAVSKVTFYRHFPTKDDLVVAYLHGRADWERNGIESMRAAHPGDPEGAFTAIAQSMVDAGCTTEFRGCPHINAAAEYSDPDHPVREAVAEHRAWYTGVLGELLAELGIRDRGETIEQLMMLRDGALVTSYLDRRHTLRATTLVGAWRAVLDAAQR
ncbi:TetR/AcrR family transcriptional regulator [Prauserella cavernicola]|uniref:TetR/AcrR family transcriptional regulator n=1 Tax=Prauserella cavernicola TaxID=2800127 RepID=A0A934QN26_9PSEU|nr:TetR/AcrR family transcriptional regulator [Prauserella cavernicola]MBK1783485.1 TetR/AcrR family transcriptional regulator [Prauserella cavernicola]